MSHALNPDSTILQQLDGRWQSMAAMLLWKLAGGKSVKITVADMEKFQEREAAGKLVMYTHGHSDSIDFQLVDRAAADRIAAHDAKMRGTA